MKKTMPEEMWCPFGRMSIHQIEGNTIKAVQTGAFNRVVMNETTYLSSRCVGEKCAFYRKGLDPFSWGRCALASNDKTWLAWLIAAVFAFLWFKPIVLAVLN